MTVNKELVGKWVETLRSGQYTQTTGQLGEVDGDGNASYCCLGVLCEVVRQDGLNLSRVAEDDSILFNSCESMPPEVVLEYVGVPEWSVTVPADQLPDYLADEYEDGREMELSSLNDDYRWDFNQIADAIEAEFLGGSK